MYYCFVRLWVLAVDERRKQEYRSWIQKFYAGLPVHQPQPCPELCRSHTKWWTMAAPREKAETIVWTKIVGYRTVKSWRRSDFILTVHDGMRKSVQTPPLHRINRKWRSMFPALSIYELFSLACLFTSALSVSYRKASYKSVTSILFCSEISLY